MRRNLAVWATAPVLAAGSLLAFALPASAGGNPWNTGGPTSSPSTITGGAWTLGQGGSTFLPPYNGYCVNGAVQPHGDAATDLIQPYYFPYIQSNDGRGNLTGIFDWRPKDANEAIVQATSSDNGQTWTAGDTTGRRLRYRSDCAITAGSGSTADKPATADDNGQGHPFVLNVGGTQRLYTLDRQSAIVDNGGLLVHTLDSTGSVSALPADEPLPATTAPSGVAQTTGLLNPDGILGQVPDRPGTASQPGTTDTASATILYVQKQKGFFSAGNTTGRCTATDARTGKSVNDDLVTVRAARTTDGVNFTDLGVVGGLHDNTSTAGAAVAAVALVRRRRRRTA